MNPGGFSVWRTLVIAENTVREAARQKLFGTFLVLALALLLGARWLRDFNFGAAELAFMADCGLGALTLFGSVFTITATAQLFLGDVENRSVLTVLAKPVARSEYLLGKYLGVLLLVGGACVVLTGTLLGALWWREAELRQGLPAGLDDHGVQYANLAIAGFLQWLKFAVLGAFVLLIASFARSQLFTMVAGFGVLLAGHLQSFAQDVYARGDTSVGRTIGQALTAALPDFHVFSFASHPLEFVASPAPDLFRITTYALGYLITACALAVFSFQRREL